jgi:hypothetical protein
MKNTTVSRPSKTKAGTRSLVESWHGGADIEILQYARSLQRAARTLLGKLEREQNPRTDWDACPVVLLYRQALEIKLKMLVGEGSKFPPSPTDPISLFRTTSLRWLAQVVCQIIKKVGWESEFTCDGVSSPAEFRALVNEVESFDPVARAIRSSRTGEADSVSEYFRRFDILQFATRLDALLMLLDFTAGGLAATWDMQQEGLAGGKFDGGAYFKPTIQ